MVEAGTWLGEVGHRWQGILSLAPALSPVSSCEVGALLYQAFLLSSLPAVMSSHTNRASQSETKTSVAGSQSKPFLLHAIFSSGYLLQQQKTDQHHPVH